MIKKTGADNTTKQKICFVVGPIGGAGTDIRTHADWLLEGIIRPTFKDNFPDFCVVRSDTITSPGMIDTQMINHLLEAELVVVDMSTLNANAFYEMGIRHMARKPVIHMFVAGTTIPFDVKPYRAIEFSVAQHSHLGIAQSQLKDAVQDAISDGYVPDNPVTKAQNYSQLEKEAEPADRILMKEILSLKSEVSSLKKSQTVNSIFPRVIGPSKAIEKAVTFAGEKQYAAEIILEATFPALNSGDVQETIDMLVNQFPIGSFSVNEDRLSFSVAGLPHQLVDGIRGLLRMRGASEIEIKIG